METKINPDVAVDTIIAMQQRIDSLQRVIDFDPTALGLRMRIQTQIKRLRWDLIQYAYENLSED